MKGYVHRVKYFRHALLLICITTVFYIVVTNILWKKNWLIVRNNVYFPNICELNNRSYIAKAIFNFACDKNSLNSFQLSFHSEKHICDQLYSSNSEPNLFTRLHREFQLFNKRKILIADIVNISNSCPSCHHIQIIGHKLYNVPRPSAANAQTRSRSVKMLLKHVMDTFPDIPDLELFFSVEDMVNLPDGLNDAFFNVPIFGITKTKKIRRGLHPDRIILMPCFTLWSWPEARAGRWSNKFHSILDAGQQMEYEKRVPKLFWRGVEFPKRTWFINVAKKYPDNVDVEVMRWDRVRNNLALAPSHTYKTLEQHCNYKYLLHQEGVTYSSRLKYLLLCGSPVVFNVIEYWEEYWYHLLENDKNIIFFESVGNETALENTLDLLKRRDHTVKDIGSKGRQLMQDYLNEHAVSCYWWKLLHEYAKLFDYKPSLYSDAVYIDDFILGGSP